MGTQRVVRVALVVTAALLMVSSTGSSQCTIYPHDGTAETGFGVAPGYVIEYCTEVVPDPGCTVEGWYWTVDQITAFTRNGVQTSVDYIAVVRETSGSGMPGDIIAEAPAQASGIPYYPTLAENNTPLPVDRVYSGYSYYSCTRLEGDTSAGVFIGGDKSAATPFTGTYGMDLAIGIWEPLTDPLVRALGQAGTMVPFHARLDGASAVPPSATTATARGNVLWGDWFVVDSSDISGNCLVHIEAGEPGERRAPICEFVDVTLPYEGTCPGLDDHLLVDGNTRHDVHIEVSFDDGGQPATVRGQIMPANLIFGDGFERGSTANW
jgi:hypothetical protein